MLFQLELVAPLKLNFCQWLLLRRRELGLTQDDIALALGISAQTVSNWERGRSIPTLTINQVKNFCQILDCQLDEIPDAETLEE
jgi:DNA-binding XRE family transcriptional regulator